MTGLGNRYTFDVLIQRRGAGTLRPDRQPYLLAVVDVDGLKRINDRHGHARGDELIRAVGQGLGKLNGADTRCYRLGGDEFAILALCRREAELHERLALLEAELTAQGFDQAGLSRGCVYWEPDSDPAALLREADRQMYRHKAERRQARQRQAAAELVTTGPTRPG